MRRQDHQIAGDMGGEQAAKPQEADRISAPRDYAEERRQQFHAE
jgi:hypothetical protein